jgi:hypothetical protein
MPRSTPPSLFVRIRRDSTDDYVKKLKHGRHVIDVRFVAETKDQLDRLIPTAERFWKGRVRWFKAFREYAATELLELLNGNLDCGEDDPPVVTAGQLRRMLPAPFSITFSEDDDDGGEVRFEMSGGTDKALLDHCIEVQGTLDDGITDGDVVALF